MKDIYVFGKLHIVTTNRHAWVMTGDGIDIHVKDDVIIHRNPNDVIILEGGDQIMENPFDKQKINDIIAFSDKFTKK